ncbi:SH3 domain-containing protein [Desertihabitans aurantiacus]|uniref:SH3 domain-containing protein n=1 Tax=Desertihabitans aurantiacus TaxID=2282477 RepID=UPI000DF812D4|nr:SH3 domain-containing protein [Desertihabitans aurantiacus]
MSTAHRVLAALGALATAFAASAVPLTATAAPLADEGRVTASGGVVVRHAPAVSSPVEGHQPQGRRIPISCWVDGTAVDGNTRWYALPPTLNEWVSARWVAVDGTVPRCAGDQAARSGRTTTALTVRRGPHTGEQSLGVLRAGQRVSLACRLPSQPVAGNDRWYKLAGSQGWVAARYVANEGAAPAWCTV